jgi:copper(I)-binding protein
VIGGVCFLIVAVLATGGPRNSVALAGADFLVEPRAALRAASPVWDMPEGVPLSLSIRSEGDEEGRLLGGSAPVAQYAAVRRSLLVQGRPATWPVSDGIVIPAYATITLELGESHLALIGLRTNLIQGATFPLTRRFERAGKVTVIARVRRRVDTAGSTPLPKVSHGDVTVALVSARTAPAP